MKSFLNRTQVTRSKPLKLGKIVSFEIKFWRGSMGGIYPKRKTTIPWWWILEEFDQKPLISSSPSFNFTLLLLGFLKREILWGRWTFGFDLGVCENGLVWVNVTHDSCRVNYENCTWIWELCMCFKNYVKSEDPMTIV